MLYVVRPGVMKTAGKAMAQAGHAALGCVREHGLAHPDAFAAWRAAGHPGTLAHATADQWEAVKALPGATVVQDAGFTQVAPGTETAIAFVPAPATERPPRLQALEPVP
jgi:peptidyl-tRNA hydrolase